MTYPTKIRATIASLVFATFALTASTSSADEAKVPQAAAEHEAMARQYQAQAAQYKKVAEDHRAMVEAYTKSIAIPIGKTGQKNPWLVKMEKHCAVLAKDADKLAADTEKAAEYHTLRAKDLQGK